jgi:RimJ/RimL family protein N-acetyltransferase
MVPSIRINCSGRVRIFVLVNILKGNVKTVNPPVLLSVGKTGQKIKLLVWGVVGGPPHTNSIFYDRAEGLRLFPERRTIRPVWQSAGFIRKIRSAIVEVNPVILPGRFVRLEPLTIGHAPGLAEVGLDDEIWRLMPYGQMRTPEDIRRWVELVLARQATGTDLVFAVIHLASGRVAGSTRYLNISPPDRSVEIGGTWYGADFRRTAVNTECKYLLLENAFEKLNCIRVQIKTDLRNERSQRAIERIGAIREGVLRDHMILPDGTIRSSVYYSILKAEWPGVRARLAALL